MNVIWVSPQGRKYCPNADQSNLGSVIMPLQSIQDAMNKIAYSSDVFWEVHVSPGFYTDSFTIPANKIVCIIGPSRVTTLGDCNWKVAGKLSSIVIFRDIGIGKLTIEDDNPDSPATLATMALENAGVNEILQTGKSSLDVGIVGISAASAVFANTLGGASVVYGDVKINNFILGTNVGFLSGKNISCETIHLQDCLIEQDLHLTGNKVIFKGTQWLSKNLSVNFTNKPGKLLVDSVSYNSYIKNKISLINGIIEVL